MIFISVIIITLMSYFHYNQLPIYDIDLAVKFILNEQKNNDFEVVSKALGYKPMYDRPLNTNPLPWTQHWLSSAGLQVAPQETEVESYIIGGIKQDVDEDVLKGFKL